MKALEDIAVLGSRKGPLQAGLTDFLFHREY